MSEPRTEAGRRLLGYDMGPEEAYWVNLGTDEMLRTVLAIEAEAAASPVLDVERLARALTRALVVPDSETADRDAANIAREYAALSETAEPGFKLSDYDPDTEGRGGT